MNRARQAQGERKDPRILVAVPTTLDNEFVHAIRGVDPRIQILQVAPEGPVPDEVADARVFFRSYALRRETIDEVLDRARGLEWMHVPAAGVDPAMVPRVLESSFTITNVAGVYDTPVAELRLAM